MWATNKCTTYFSVEMFSTTPLRTSFCPAGLWVPTVVVGVTSENYLSPVLQMQ